MFLRTSLPLAFLAGSGCEGTPPDRTPNDAHPPPEAPILDPGVRTVPRINRTQYNNSVRDVFGTAQRPADVFPLDETAAGFDNQGAALTTTSTHVELWELAADNVLDEMFGRTEEETIDYATQAEGAGVFYTGVGQPYESSGYTLVDGGLSITQSLQYDGTFEIAVLGFGRDVGGEDPELAVDVDGVVVATITVDAPVGPAARYPVETYLGSGVHAFTFTIANPYDGGIDGRRNVTIDRIEITGPLDPEGGPTPAYEELAGCAMDGDPDAACARDALTATGERSWGRPLDTAEVDWAVSLYDAAIAAGEDTSWALQYAVKGLLMSPEFLYHLEADVEPGQTARALDGYEVADRLAAFVWASTPDTDLVGAAASGDLLQEGGVAAALDRLLADEKAAALVDSLATQWFDIDALESFLPNADLYPEYDDELAVSLQTELRLLTESFFRGEVDLLSLLLREESWIDGRLADHYGVPFSGSEDEFVLLPNGRTGILGNAGWLTAHSNPEAPSAVRRGKWILENLLCDAPPPPPPDVEGSFDPDPAVGSIREQEEALRADAFCQSCHREMDPIGYVLYGFDAIGQDRTFDELGFPIDTTVMLDDVTLATPEELAAWVTADPRLPSCVVEKTMTYAVGRAIEDGDEEAVAAVTEAFVAGGLTFRALALAIATSEPFLYRGAVPTSEEE